MSDAQNVGSSETLLFVSAVRHCPFFRLPNLRCFWKKKLSLFTHVLTRPNMKSNWNRIIIQIVDLTYDKASSWICALLINPWNCNSLSFMILLCEWRAKFRSALMYFSKLSAALNSFCSSSSTTPERKLKAKNCTIHHHLCFFLHVLGTKVVCHSFSTQQMSCDTFSRNTESSLPHQLSYRSENCQVADAWHFPRQSARIWLPG